MSEIATDTPFRVTDLKQWVYCPRILYYYTCLPEVRPVTFRMEAGIEAGQEEENREERRSLRAYGLLRGKRDFNVPVASSRLGLRGIVDMVICLEGKREDIIPVDYKFSERSGEHFQLQLAAYGLLLEEMTGGTARRGFLYHIPERQAVEIKLDRRLRGALLKALDQMHKMLYSELMPDPTCQHSRCVSCEFRRFCNDIA